MIYLILITMIMALASHQDERTALCTYQRKILNLKTIQLEMPYPIQYLVIHVVCFWGWSHD